MNPSYDVKFWETRRNKSSKTPSYYVRWTVAGRVHSKTFRTKALAESFLSDLRQAAKNGEAFDQETGLPESMLTPVKESGPTLLTFAQSYVADRWRHISALSREAITYALLSVVPVLVDDVPNAPEADELRAVLRTYALLPESRRPELPKTLAGALGWLEKASLPVADLSEPRVIRMALDAIALTFAGEPAAATTVRRKRAILHHMLEMAVELKELQSNPLHTVRWTPPKASEVVDPGVVVNPVQARSLLAAVGQVGRTRGPRMVAMFACMYYAALRSEEVAALRLQNCQLPEKGWGLITLDRARPQANRRWSESGRAHDERGLKHRAQKETRTIPIPPVLVALLREHIAKYDTADDGTLFATRTGGRYSASACSQIWQQARRLALTPEQYASRLKRLKGRGLMVEPGC
ncbi:site-specific integrase [Streptosporangiaceae bacterium NEAU-GS5]|nr:site-specific integrase [Streptosporangiaceae bacterium NEAU-GS5]